MINSDEIDIAGQQFLIQLFEQTKGNSAVQVSMYDNWWPTWKPLRLNLVHRAPKRRLSARVCARFWQYAKIPQTIKYLIESERWSAVKSVSRNLSSFWGISFFLRPSKSGNHLEWWSIPTFPPGRRRYPTGRRPIGVKPLTWDKNYSCGKDKENNKVDFLERQWSKGRH